eukprot:scaffold4485_cov135-Isochrysis_galbana.AAC.2
MADSGMIDAFRLVHGDTRAGYSRLAHTIHSPSIVRSKGMHAALKPSLRKKRPEEGDGMEKNGKGEGECPDGMGLRCPAESPLVCSAFF